MTTTFPGSDNPTILAQISAASATITATGNLQAVTGGGVLLAPIVVKEAGSADAVATLYDGTDDTGAMICTVALGVAGPKTVPNYAFARGLFIVTSGTTAGTTQYNFSYNGSV